MDFALFILVNIAMFIRPSDISPALAGLPLYLILILACTLVALPRLLAQWTAQPLSGRPITACVLGLLAAVILSHLSQGHAGPAFANGFEFAKNVLYYLLLVAIVDSPSRLHRLFIWLLICITAMTCLALLQYHEFIEIPALKVLERGETDPATGERTVVLQLVGMGFFNDPNDLCIMLSAGILIGLCLFSDRSSSPARIAYLLPVGLLGYAVLRTQSRGGLLAILGGLMALLTIRLGYKRAILLAAISLPLIFAGLGGRFAKMSTEEGTAQERFEKWRDAFVLFRRAPVFGIGVNTLADEIGLVSHNSYVHSFAETGFFGGTCFIGAFYFAGLILYRSGRIPADELAPRLLGMRPYLVAILTSTAIGLYSLTRNYAISTYLPLAIIEAYHRLLPGEPLAQTTTLSVRSGVECILFSLFILCFLHIFIAFLLIGR